MVSAVWPAASESIPMAGVMRFIVLITVRIVQDGVKPLSQKESGCMDGPYRP
jgi:hypothetical protein